MSCETTSTISVGDLVRCVGTFKDANLAVVDPATVTFKYKDPSGNATTLVYGTDAALFREGVGVYHVDVNADESGTWFYRFHSTGSAQAADESEFAVAASRF